MANIGYTTITQSVKLLELGLSPETADMSYRFHTGYGEYYPSFGVAQKDSDISCWTVGALLEAMPDKIENYIFLCVKGYGEVCILYTDAQENRLHDTDGDTLVEAAYKMMVWLLENGYINTK